MPTREFTDVASLEGVSNSILICKIPPSELCNKMYVISIKNNMAKKTIPQFACLARAFYIVPHTKYGWGIKAILDLSGRG